MRKKNFLIFLAYLIPVLIFFYLDIFIFKRPYYLGTGDGVQSELGLSLNFLFNDPLVFFHHPGYITSQIGAIFLYFFGIPKYSLQEFAFFGVVIHLITHVLTGLLIGKHLEGVAKQPILSSFALSLLFISMPTNAVYQQTWHCYYFIAQIAFISAICLMVHAHKFNPRGIKLGGLLLGLAFATLLLGIYYLIFAVIFITSLYFLEKIDADTESSKFSKIFMTLAFAVFAICMPRPFRYGFIPLIFGVGFLLWGKLNASYLKVMKNLFKDFYLPIVLGWFVASNIYFSSWKRGFRTALHEAGGGSDKVTNWFDLDLGPLLEMNLYFIIFIAALLVSLLMVFISKNRRDRFLSYSIFTSLLICFLLTAKKMSISILSPEYHFGYTIRYWILSVSIIPFFWLLFKSKKSQLLLNFFIICVSIASLIQFSQVYGNNDLHLKLDQEVIHFLKRSKRNAVICVEEYVPDICGPIYGLNQYNYIRKEVRQKISLNNIDNQIFHRKVSDCTTVSSCLKSLNGEFDEAYIFTAAIQLSPKRKGIVEEKKIFKIKLFHYKKSK